MTIKIEKVTLAKDKMDIIGENEGRPIYNGCNYFKGELHIAVRNGVINAKQELDIENINKNLQKKLYDVLNEIEHELNGENLITGENIENDKVTVVNIHSKETILPKDDAQKLLDIEKIIETSKKFEERIKETGNSIGNSLKTCGNCKGQTFELKENGSATISGGNIKIEDSEDGKIYFKVDGNIVGYVGKWKTCKSSPEAITININMAGTDVNQAKSSAKEFVETLKKKAEKSD